MASAGGVLKQVFAERRYRRVAWVVFLLYTLIYLLVTRFIVVSGAPAEVFFGAEFLPNWMDVVFRQRAPFLFESIGSIQLTPYVTIFLSIPNLILAFILSELVALNIAISYFVFRKVGWQGGKGVASLIGTIPALLGGAACCVPTLILVLGLQFTATLSTVWPLFVPLSILLLIGSLWWVIRQAEKNPNICRV